MLMLVTGSYGSYNQLLVFFRSNEGMCVWHMLCMSGHALFFSFLSIAAASFA